MRLNKHLKRFLIILLVFSWLLSSWPPVWLNPRFPPKIQEAQAAFPVVAATNGGNTTSNTTSHTVNLPSGIASGHLLIVVFSLDASGTRTITWPSGWTQLFIKYAGSTPQVYLEVRYRIADGSEGSTITVTSSHSEGSAHTSYRITGHGGSGNPPQAGTAVVASTSSVNPPALSPTGGAKDYLWLPVMAHDVGTNFVLFYPQNYTNGINNRWNYIDGVGVGSAQRSLNAATEDPSAFEMDHIAGYLIANTIAVHPAPPTTTLGTGTDPTSATVAPGSAIRDAGAFTFQTSAGTDSITALTVTLAASGTPYNGVGEVRITNSAGTTTYFSAIANPTSNTLNFSGGTAIPASTTLTTFKIRVTPKTHAAMAAPPGAAYNLSPYVSAWTSGGGNTPAGSDSNANTLTIDNLSPSGATSTSGSAGNAQVTLNWTTSSSTDFSRSVVLRWAAGTPGSEVPAEGTDYSVGNTIGTATVACVRTADAASTAVSGTDGAGTGGCSAVALTNGQAYSYKVFQKDSNGNYDIGVTFTGSPFTPQAPTFNQSAYRLFDNLNSTNVGTALAAQDTAATLGSTGAAFRLRALIHVGTSTLPLNGQTFKLQFAEQSGTCDTGFVGETYADVTAATVIAYNNNATPADGNNLTANANDPTHGGDTIVNQDYEELNNFTNSVAAITAGQDGKWDFALFDNGATGSTAYCFRAVKSDATVLDTYSVIPEITTAAGGPTLEQLLRHGDWFNASGVEQPYTF